VTIEPSDETPRAIDRGVNGVLCEARLTKLELEPIQRLVMVA
jgi:hypothetical protein